MATLEIKYTEVFDARSSQWTKDRDYNLMFLRQIQAHYNDVLKARRFVFLWDVLDMLGLPEPDDLRIRRIGWMWDDKRDNYIDFGMENDETSDLIINLNFNVDGFII